MYLMITEFFNSVNPKNLSASNAELGDNAGAITWQNCTEDHTRILNTPEEFGMARAWIDGFGAWDVETLSDATVHALVKQFIAGNMREHPDFELSPQSTVEEWEAFEAAANEGRISGGIFKGDDGEIYFMMG